MTTKYFSAATVMRAAMEDRDLWQEPTEQDNDGEALIFEHKSKDGDDQYSVICASDGGGAGSAHFWTLTAGDELDHKHLIKMVAVLLLA